MRRGKALDAAPVAFDKDFLRWMLPTAPAPGWSSPRGARAQPARRLIAVLPRPRAAGLHVRAPRRSGSAARLDGDPGHEREATSIFALKQDVRLLNEAVVEYTLEKPLQRLIAQHKLVARDIDWFLPHMSSEFFRSKVAQALERIGLPLPKERWFTNLTWTGNTGSAAIYIMLDELLRSGKVKPGQRLLCFVPESGRFSSGYIHLTAVAHA
jgi:3-oxoacyl-[acyl-carrier-protein] synthase-3